MRIFKSVLTIIVPIAILSACTGPNLQEDPRNSKYFKLLSEKYATAVKILDQDLQKDPNSLQAQYARATVEVEHGKLDNGIELLNKLVDRYPTYSFAYSERSRANCWAQHYEQAISDADLAIRFRPDVARNYVRRATAYLSMHQADKVMADLKTAEHLAPDEDKVYIALLRGLALMDLREYKQALPLLTESVAHAGKDERPYVQRARCYAFLKDWDRAQADADKALKLRPDNLNVKVLHAALLSATGKREQARQLLLPCVKGAFDERGVADTSDLGSDVPSVADVALACLSAGNPNAAKAILTLIEARRPLDANEMYAQAKIYLAVNDRFRAAKLLNECLASEPSWGEPRVELIKLYLKDNLPQKARDVQKEGLALHLSPQDRKMVASAMR